MPSVGILRSSAFRMVWIVFSAIFGLPGPLDTTMPSKEKALAGEKRSQFHGTVITRTFLERRQRVMLRLAPQSIRAIVIFPPGLDWYSIITNEWVGHAQDLTSKGGIGQGFRIADHAGAKDDLARAFSLIAK